MNSIAVAIILYFLHRIHETLLHFVEDDDTDTQQQAHEDETINQPPPADKGAAAQESVLEGLDNRGHRVQAHESMDGNPHETHASGLAQRIDDRGRIHPELDQETEKHLQVTILGGHRRNDRSKSQRKAGHHQDKDREKKSITREMSIAVRIRKGIDQIDQEEESELDSKAEQITDYIRNWHHQTGEIDLAEDTRIGDEGVRGLGHAFCEIVPHTSTGQVKEWPGNAVRRNARDASEHDHIHDDRQCRLDDKPGRSQNRLLVLGNNIPLDKQGTKVPVGQKLLEINREQLILRFDDDVPLFLLDGGFFFCHIS